MTVGELIERLRSEDPGALVLVEAAEAESHYTYLKVRAGRVSGPERASGYWDGEFEDAERFPWQRAPEPVQSAVLLDRDVRL